MALIMDVTEQSPFFPVPVRWFELPVSTSRWGFVQPQELRAQGRPGSPGAILFGEAGASAPNSQQTASHAAAENEPEVGRILNARA
jgi:hypothetical protein